MKTVDLNKLEVVDLNDLWIDLDENDFQESGVYKIEIGSRGEVESVVKDDLDYESEEDLGEYFDEEFYNVDYFKGMCEVSLSEEEGYLFVKVEV